MTKVQDINKNKKPSYDSSAPITTLNFVLGIVGLRCITRDGKSLKYTWPSVKIVFILIFFSIITCLSIYYNFKIFYNNNSKFMYYIPLIYSCSYIQYIIDLIYVYKYGRQGFLDYLLIYEHVDKILGIPCYNEINRSIRKMFIFFICLCSLAFVSDVAAFLMNFGGAVTAVHALGYVYVSIKMLSGLDGIAHCTELKYRLKRIEEILEDYYYSVANLPGISKDFIDNRDRVKTVYTVNRLDSLSPGHSRYKIVLQLNRCYLLLLEQCDYINSFFGFRVLIGSLVYLLEMVLLLNFVIGLLMGTFIAISYNIPSIPLVSTMMKILNYCCIALCGINRCEQNYKLTGNIVRTIDHLLANKKIAFEVHDHLKELKQLIISRPVVFSAVDFYRLDYPALLSMASAIVTYTIILVQSAK